MRFRFYSDTSAAMFVDAIEALGGEVQVIQYGAVLEAKDISDDSAIEIAQAVGADVVESGD